MKNFDVIGSLYADSQDANEWNSSTGVVVVGVTQGDHVYVRVGRPTAGIVRSNTYSRTAFSGWILD
jgi:hypothetical protein